MERLRGMAAPKGRGPLAGGTGSLAQALVAAYGAPTGDGSPHLRRPTSWVLGEVFLPHISGGLQAGRVGKQYRGS